MDSTYYHLLINELPLVGVLAGIVMLIVALIISNRAIKRTSLIVFIASALLTVPSYFTGMNASGTVSQLEGVDQAFIDAHREIAYEFVRMIALLGLIATVTLVVDFRENKKASRILYVATLGCAIFMFFLTQSIGTSGREIRHPEIRQEKTE